MEDIMSRFRPYRCKGFLKNGKRCKTKCKDFKIFCCPSHTPPGIDYNNLYCPICYDEMYYFNIFVLKCGHYFHKKCLHDWMTKHSYSFSCPMCRTSYKFPTEIEDKNKYLENIFRK